jgi:hypothetical protein
VEHLYAIADREVAPEPGEPRVIWCMDEFGPLNLQPRPGRQRAARGGRHKDPDPDAIEIITDTDKLMTMCSCSASSDVPY